MNKINLEDLPLNELIPGFSGRMIHSENMTIAYWDIEAGSDLPAHSHHHEQIVNLMDGEFELNVAGEPQILKPGMVVVIPSNVEHSGKAITNCKIIDVFSPRRDDYA